MILRFFLTLVLVCPNPLQEIRRRPIFPPAGASMARICSGTAFNDASGNTITTSAQNCSGANACFGWYQEATNSTPTFSDNASGTWANPTDFHASNGGDLYIAVASNFAPGAAFTFTATTVGNETFRRAGYVCFSNGNAAGAIDGNVSGTGTGSTSPVGLTTVNGGAGSSFTPSASGGVVVCAASNNDGTIGTFSAGSGFTLDANHGGANGVQHDSNLEYGLGLTGSVTPQINMTITGGATRIACVSLKK